VYDERYGCGANATSGKDLVMLDQLKSKLPLLLGLVYTGQFKRQLADTIAIIKPGGSDVWDRFHDAAEAKRFRSRYVLYHMLMSLRIDGAYEPTAELIERDLEKISAAGVSEGQMRDAFQSKLVNDAQFDDVVYEIASAAIFSQILDSGTCKLEHPLVGTAVNPDLTGEWQGIRTRVEVKRVDDMPPRYVPEALTIIESAEIPGGFNLHLNVPLISGTEAEFIKRMVEQLHEHRALQRGGQVRVGGFLFTMGRGYLNAADHQSPIRSIEFNDESEFRHVQSGVLSGTAISPTEQTLLAEAFPEPEGVQVFDNARVNSSARISSTKGERIYNDVKGKLRQSEAGAINIVVLGLSAPHYSERDFGDGLLGSSFVLAGRHAEAKGPTLLLSRTGLGPFTARANLAALSADTNERFRGLIDMIHAEIDQFEKVSGVLGIRLLSANPLALFRLNPNAATAAPANAGDLIMPAAVARSECGSPGNRPRTEG
jgi:hypothetical protein